MNFNKNYLIKIIKIYKLKNYSKLKKNELIELINKNKSAIVIQQYFRKKIDSELICPITLCKCVYPFVCIKNYNKFRYYSLNEFIIYLNKSNGEFIDPFTRESISDNNLNEINKLIKYYKIDKIIKTNIWKKKLRIRHNYLLIINNINNIFTNLFQIDNLTINIIYNNILPQLIYYFHFLFVRYKSQCYILIRNYINCINNHPHKNKKYLIDYFNLLIIVNNL